MRVQCPECGFLRPAGADPCPSCGAEAPAPSGGTRAGGGSSLRQWKERYQTGQLPGLSSRAPDRSTSGSLTRRTSGPLTLGQGQSAPNWGSESPSSSIPPSAGLGSRRSGSLTPPPDAPTRRSGGFSSPSWPGVNNPTPPPPGRTSGSLGNSQRGSSSEFGNGSASWKWRNQGTQSGMGLGGQMSAPGYDEPGDYQDDVQDEPAPRASGRFRDESMLPVPYQSNRRPWGQSDDQNGYDEADDQDMYSGNLPAPMGMGRGSSAFPALLDGLPTTLPSGRKAPAFIPATRPRRPYRLSNYRIISGTISVALVVLLVIGGLGFLVVKTNFIQNLLGGKQLPALNYQYNQGNCQVPTGTQQATPSTSPAAKIIAKVVTAKNYNSKTYDPIDPASTFQTGQTVNVLWQVRPPQASVGLNASAKSLAGTAPDDAQAAPVGNVISIKWYQNCMLIDDLPQSSTQEKITDSQPYNGVFGLCYPTSGVGKAELYWNSDLAQTIQFTITGNPTQCS